MPVQQEVNASDLFAVLDCLGAVRIRRNVGEGDECTCAQCQGVELPDWLSRLGDGPEERTNTGTGDRLR